MTMPDAAGAASCPATRAPTADERIPTRTATESDRRFIYAPLRRLTAPILATKDAKPHVFVAFRACRGVIQAIDERVQADCAATTVRCVRHTRGAHPCVRW